MYKEFRRNGLRACLKLFILKISDRRMVFCNVNLLAFIMSLQKSHMLTFVFQNVEGAITC